MKKPSKLKLSVGDTVYLRIPTNGKIISVNKRFGYTIETNDGTKWSYFGDDEVSLIRKAK